MELIRGDSVHAPTSLFVEIYFSYNINNLLRAFPHSSVFFRLSFNSVVNRVLQMIAISTMVVPSQIVR